MPLTTKLPFFLIILLLSCLNNLLVPFAIYFKKFGSGYHPAKEKFAGGACNVWGVIMDGLLAGAINVIALNLLLEIQPQLIWRDGFLVFLGGFLSMALAHVWMAVKQWRVWIMPRPGRWNEGGYWHMFSMTLQMGFLYYPLLIILENPRLWHESFVQLSLLTTSLFALVFVLCFRMGKKGVKVGHLCLDGEPW